ncbi:MAG: UDP-N-acetylmuramate dehydrogenase [Runella slithyformis]|nr:MAG: UDP-N-acetylmuramate dehydrogenase [Runella slithyformis]
MLTIQSNISLKPYNTFGIDALSRYFIEINAEEDLQTLYQLAELQRLDKLILGGGSNIVLTQDFGGLTIKISIKGIEQIREDNAHVWLKVGAGEPWHGLVLHCVERGYGGIENLALIPGTVGAAPIQNIGAYGVELKDTFQELCAVEVATGQKLVFSKTDCQFGYRDSIFKQHAKERYFITSVTLRLNKTPVFRTEYGDIQKTLEQMGVKEPSIRAISEAVIKIRRSKLPDPAELGNAGSFFKNPEILKIDHAALQTDYPEMPSYPIDTTTVKIPAGWLIEQCGWKGKRLGNVGVHARQALVLVNYGGGTGLEIRQLSEKIQQSVQARFGIKLQPEVNFV